MNDRLFVERRFDLGNHEVTARFYTPVLAPGGEYQCRWRIEWPGREQERYACGIDGLQALMLAMRVVHTKLMETDEYQAGTLTGVFIVPHVRGRGYVGHLLAAFDEACQAASVTTAWLYTSNAEQVYRRRRWQIEEIIERHGKPPATLMRRDLPSGTSVSS